MKSLKLYVALSVFALLAASVAFVVYINNPHQGKVYRLMNDEFLSKNDGAFEGDTIGVGSTIQVLEVNAGSYKVVVIHDNRPADTISALAAVDRFDGGHRAMSKDGLVGYIERTSKGFNHVLAD
jgi:hypothetical protein